MEQGWSRKLASALVAGLILCLATPGLQPFSLPFPFQLPAVALLAVAVLWLQHDHSLTDSIRLALARPLATLLIADALAFFVLVILSRLLLPSLLGQLFPPGHDRPSVDSFVLTELGRLFRFIASAWLSAAIAEEMIFRVFLLEQCERLFGAGRWARSLACLLGATVFGLAHYAQDPAGVITTGAVGLSFCAAYYLSRKNVLALILAHGFIDTYSLIALYKPHG